MELQYISDDSGKHTAVIIPIAEWDSLMARYDILKASERPVETTKKRKLSDFIGCISKDTAIKMIADVEKSRSEWERNS